MPHNLCLHSQHHTLILFNLYPATAHPASAETGSTRAWVFTMCGGYILHTYRWWRTVCNPRPTPCSPHTPGCRSSRAPCSCSLDSLPHSCRRWSLSQWKPRLFPIGWHWAGVSTFKGVTKTFRLSNTVALAGFSKVAFPFLPVVSFSLRFFSLYKFHFPVRPMAPRMVLFCLNCRLVIVCLDSGGTLRLRVSYFHGPWA